MKFVNFAILAIIGVICLAFATEFDEEFDGNHYHDENIHDEPQDGLGPLASVASDLFSMSKEEVTGHFKDIIRGFADKGFEDCDKDNDGFLAENEVMCFVTDKMGFSIKTTPSYVIHHYDRDQNDKLDKEEIWNIVEDKDPAIFKILPSTVEKNMLLMHGMQEEHIELEDQVETTDDGIPIRY